MPGQHTYIASSLRSLIAPSAENFYGTSVCMHSPMPCACLAFIEFRACCHSVATAIFEEIQEAQPAGGDRTNSEFCKLHGVRTVCLWSSSKVRTFDLSCCLAVTDKQWIRYLLLFALASGRPAAGLAALLAGQSVFLAAFPNLSERIEVVLHSTQRMYLHTV